MDGGIDGRVQKDAALWAYAYNEDAPPEVLRGCFITGEGGRTGVATLEVFFAKGYELCDGKGYVNDENRATARARALVIMTTASRRRGTPSTPSTRPHQVQDFASRVHGTSTARAHRTMGAWPFLCVRGRPPLSMRVPGRYWSEILPLLEASTAPSQ